MIDQQGARELARKAISDPTRIDPDRCTETREGWYFPYARLDSSSTWPDEIGSSGVIVHKRLGHVLVLGSSFPVERDIWAFDLGYQYPVYDLVVTEIRSYLRTISALDEIGLIVTVPEYASGTLWRIPRRLNKLEIARRLLRLPAVFENVALYWKVELLQKVRDDGCFRFEALPAKR